MNQLRTAYSHFQNLLDVLVGIRPFQPLPEAFFNQPDWHQAEKSLRSPAVWRRAIRVH